jgi:hypothetical protein
MSIERELLQTALGILEDYEWGYGGDHHKSPEASILNDIRKLLAQPEQTEQEPVAWIIETEIYGKLSEWVCTDKKRYMEAHDGTKDPIPLYLAPKREQGLREDLREGISFCDHFAGLAMQGLLNGVDNYTMSTKATWAYNMADAMLMERSKRDEQR